MSSISVSRIAPRYANATHVRNDSAKFGKSARWVYTGNSCVRAKMLTFPRENQHFCTNTRILGVKSSGGLPKFGRVISDMSCVSVSGSDTRYASWTHARDDSAKFGKPVMRLSLGKIIILDARHADLTEGKSTSLIANMQRFPRQNHHFWCSASWFSPGKINIFETQHANFP